VSIRPYWLVRTVAGISMDIGMSLLVYNLMRTVLAGRAEARVGAARAPGAAPEGARA
jgi:cytochrome c oxidase cbb3-type subunit 1